MRTLELSAAVILVTHGLVLKGRGDDFLAQIHISASRHAGAVNTTVPIERMMTKKKGTGAYIGHARLFG